MNFTGLKEIQLDALKEICNIGMGHAATALSQMIGRSVNLRVPKITVALVADTPDIIGGPGQLVVGIHLKIYGDARGDILLIFPKDSAKELLSLLLGNTPEDDDLTSEISVSALNEVGNILASAHLSAMSRLMGVTLIPSMPSMALDMAGAILDPVLAELGEAGDWALVIETEFVGETKVRGHFFIMPDPNSIDVLLKACKVDG